VEGTAASSGDLGEHRGVPTPLPGILARGRAASLGGEMSCSAFYTSAGSRKERNHQDHNPLAKIKEEIKEGDWIRSSDKNKGGNTFHSVSKPEMLLVDFLFS
jgi:hypothetical protein